MIYVASSWRNEYQPEVVARLRAEGFEVFDFRHPAPGDNGFHWSALDPYWQQWTPERFRAVLRSSTIAADGFNTDFAGMLQSDTFILVLPCGRSAHLEMGWAVGAGKRTIALLADGEPELMYRMLDHLCISLEEVLCLLKGKSAA